MSLKIPLLTIGLTCIAFASEAVQLPEITECPLGHKNLKKIPIEYGRRASLSSSEMKAIEDKELFHGGCVVGTAKDAIVCQTCKYDYQLDNRSPLENKPSLFTGTWSRTTKNPKDFPAQFSDEILAFRPPAGAVITKQAEYKKCLSQSLVRKQESCKWAISSFDEQIESSINNWFKERKISPKIEITTPTKISDDKIKRIHWTYFSPTGDFKLISFTLEFDEARNESRARFGIVYR